MAKMPHDQTFVRLKPSKIHGVGVFAIRRIRKDDPIFPDEGGEIISVSKKDVDKLPPEMRKLYEDFAVYEGDKVWVPPSFNNMGIAWFLNHSKNPNVYVDDELRFLALRNIEVDEELTADYRMYSDIPDPAIIGE